MMTIDETIEYYKDKAKHEYGGCAKEHLQLAEWLEELKELREQVKANPIRGLAYTEITEEE